MPTEKKIRIVIADDHNIVRDGIATLLSSQEDIQVVAEAANGKQAVEQAAKTSPDIVLMDISMPEMDGIKAATEILKASPSTKILMLTQYDQEEYVKRVMHSGVSGYILKSSLFGDLVAAIRTVHSGKRFITPSVSATMMDSYFQTNNKSQQKNTPRLTNREQEILQLVAMGWSNQQISGKLFISVRTVEFHRTNIMEKLGVHDTASLVRYAILHNLIDTSL
jgi:two-component system, NarL family, response regulator NreC